MRMRVVGGRCRWSAATAWRRAGHRCVRCLRPDDAVCRTRPRPLGGTLPIGMPVRYVSCYPDSCLSTFCIVLPSRRSRTSLGRRAVEPTSGSVPASRPGRGRGRSVVSLTFVSFMCACAKGVDFSVASVETGPTNRKLAGGGAAQRFCKGRLGRDRERRESIPCSVRSGGIRVPSSWVPRAAV